MTPFKNSIVGVTGGRNPNEDNTLWVRDQINKLPERTSVMVGLAEGIDTIAAVEAINRGLPVIGVLPHGLDRDIFPRSNQKLARQILDKGGVLISEYPKSKNKSIKNRTRPFPKKNFVERDKIIADADKLIAAEGGKGTQHTIDFAKEFGTPIIQYNKNEYLRQPKNNEKQPIESKPFVNPYVRNREYLKNQRMKKR